MSEAQLQQVLVDLEAELHRNELKGLANGLLQEWQAVLASYVPSSQTSDEGNAKRFRHLKQRCEACSTCLHELHRAEYDAAGSRSSLLQQRLCHQLMEASRELCRMHEQQQTLLGQLTGRHERLQEDHEVLRKNLSSLKLTVQQLLSDVSVLLQHTASLQKQQKQQHADRKQGHSSEHVFRQPELQRRLVRAGCTSSGACKAAGMSSCNQGASRERMCVSDDGSKLSAPAGAATTGRGIDASGMVTLAIRRLIASIDLMSQHFADCHSGKLIDSGNSPGSSPAVSKGASTAARVAAGKNLPNAAASASAVRAPEPCSGRRKSDQRDHSIHTRPTADDLHKQRHYNTMCKQHKPVSLLGPVGVDASSMRSTDSSKQPHPSGQALPAVAGTAAPTSFQQGAAVDVGTADDAAVWNTPNVRKDACDKPAQLLSDNWPQSKQGVTPAEPAPREDRRRQAKHGVLRDSMTSEQAKAVADAWFAQTARRPVAPEDLPSWPCTTQPASAGLSAATPLAATVEAGSEGGGRLTAAVTGHSHLTSGTASSAEASQSAAMWGSLSSGGCGSFVDSVPNSRCSNQQVHGLCKNSSYRYSSRSAALHSGSAQRAHKSQRALTEIMHAPAAIAAPAATTAVDVPGQQPPVTLNAAVMGTASQVAAPQVRLGGMHQHQMLQDCLYAASASASKDTGSGMCKASTIPGCLAESHQAHDKAADSTSMQQQAYSDVAAARAGRPKAPGHKCVQRHQHPVRSGTWQGKLHKHTHAAVTQVSGPHGNVLATATAAAAGPLTSALRNSTAHRHALQLAFERQGATPRRHSSAGNRGRVVRRMFQRSLERSATSRARSVTTCAFHSGDDFDRSSCDSHHAAQHRRPPQELGQGTSQTAATSSPSTSSRGSDAVLMGSATASPAGDGCTSASPRHGHLQPAPAARDNGEVVAAQVTRVMRRLHMTAASAAATFEVPASSRDESQPQHNQQQLSDKESLAPAGSPHSEQKASSTGQQTYSQSTPPSFAGNLGDVVSSAAVQHSTAGSGSQEWAGTALKQVEQMQHDDFMQNPEQQFPHGAAIDSATVRLLPPIHEERLGRRSPGQLGSCTSPPRTSTPDNAAALDRALLNMLSSTSCQARHQIQTQVPQGVTPCAAPGVYSVEPSAEALPAGPPTADALREQQREGAVFTGDLQTITPPASGNDSCCKASKTDPFSPPDTDLSKDTAQPCKEDGRTARQQAGCLIRLWHSQPQLQHPACSTVLRDAADTSMLQDGWKGSAAAAGACSVPTKSWDGSVRSAHQMDAHQQRSRPLAHSVGSLMSVLLESEGSFYSIPAEPDTGWSQPGMPLATSADSDTPAVVGGAFACDDGGAHPARASGHGGFSVSGRSSNNSHGDRDRSHVASVEGKSALELQDLLAIVLDVFNDKQTADSRASGAGRPQQTLAQHLQSYVAAKVHGNQAAYTSALSAILTGLQQHEQVQPEVAVFSKVLACELDEDYFHHTHVRLRQHLQQLATQALLSSPHTQLSQHLQQRPVLWEDCCSEVLQKEQWQQLLRMWAAERHQLLSQQRTAEPQQLEEWVHDWELTVQLHCGPGPTEAVYAGTAVAALLLFEVQQQLVRLRPIADAFRAADSSSKGMLGLQDFRAICRRLNPAMSDDEVQELFCNQLSCGQDDQITFTTICRALLPAL